MNSMLPVLNKTFHTSLPAMQWKNNSWVLMPVRKRPITNPLALGDISYGWKEGTERPLFINDGRRPSSSIWPSKQDICMQLTCRLEIGNNVKLTLKGRQRCSQFCQVYQAYRAHKTHTHKKNHTLQMWCNIEIYKTAKEIFAINDKIWKSIWLNEKR